ncbi:Set domain group [Thalictrum thalictroides]|uniref:Set domain group n=1 Tax=Thalictrum thalictroides TaxID=46969 RepID=A0A7J6VBG4_THATH|nr:Set domain group [Thalictrum thalictroides]
MEESFETFLNWATKLGITDSPQHNLLSQSTPSSCLGKSLYVSHFPEAGGRGLAAIRDLRKSELILRVPKSALMTRESLTANDQKLASCIARHTHLSSTQKLSVCLLAEMGKGKSSWWHLYLMQVPRHYDTLASFTKFETQALQVDDAIWTTERVISKAESDWKEAYPLMRELQLKPQLSTFKAWLWASATVSSRTMHVPWDDAGCLCPVGDFFNYAAPGEELFDGEEDLESRNRDTTLQSNILWDDKDSQENKDAEQLERRLTDAGYEKDVDAYCFYARDNYKKGEQVFLSYGTYTNLELLEHYGFRLNVNPNEKAFLPLEADIHSKSWPQESLYIQWDGKPSFALLSALRLWATPQNQRKFVSRLAYSGLQLSAENEIAVMKWLVANCHTLLERLPSSIDEDVLLLDFIDSMHMYPIHEVEQISFACGDEIISFFEDNKLQKNCNAVAFPLPSKAIRSLGRWKLSVQWRLRYKQILVCCVSYCKEVIEFLSSQHISCKKAILT